MTLSPTSSHGGGGASPVETSVVSLSSAQIKTLKDTPVVVVAAPGAGRGIFLVGHLCQLRYVAPAYTIAGGGQPNFAYQGDEANAFNMIAPETITSGGNHLDADFGGAFGSISGFAAPNQAVVENKAITFFCTTANPAAGNGTLVVNVYYITATLL